MSTCKNMHQEYAAVFLPGVVSLRTRNYSHPPQSCPLHEAKAKSDRQEGKDTRRPDWATIRDFEVDTLDSAGNWRD